MESNILRLNTLLQKWSMKVMIVRENEVFRFFFRSLISNKRSSCTTTVTLKVTVEKVPKTENCFLLAYGKYCTAVFFWLNTVFNTDINTVFSSNTQRKLLEKTGVDLSTWRSRSPPIPQQHDCVSCGIYAIKVGQQTDDIHNISTKHKVYRLS